jgi:hypothetical protein
MRAIRSIASSACARSALGTFTCLAVNSTSMVSLRSSLSPPFILAGERKILYKQRIKPLYSSHHLTWPHNPGTPARTATLIIRDKPADGTSKPAAPVRIANERIGMEYALMGSRTEHVVDYSYQIRPYG